MHSPDASSRQTETARLQLVRVSRAGCTSPRPLPLQHCALQRDHPTTHTLRHMNLTTPTAARLSALRHRPIEACASPHGLLGPNWLQSQGKPTGNCSCFTCIPSSYCQCLLRRSQFTGTSPAIPAARCSLNASSLTSLLSWDMYSSRVLRSVTSWLTTSSSDAQR